MNKKIILTGISIFIFLLTMNAQVGLGPKLGLNLATLTLDEDDDTEYRATKPGMVFGGVFNIPFSEATSFQAELLYSRKGIKFSDDEYSLTFRMNYLEVPLLFKLSFGSGNIKGFVNAGPYFSYWVSGATVERYGSSKSVYRFESEDFEGSNRFDVGFNLGGGVAISLGVGELILEPRYGLGFIDINDWDGNKPDDVRANLNSVFSLSASYLFRFGG